MKSKLRTVVRAGLRIQTRSRFWHFSRQSVTPQLMRATHAMVLCAGLGTRLRPLTEERPKPLVPVLGQPLASWAIAHLAAVGVQHLVCNAFHLGEQVQPTLEPYAHAHGCSLETLIEPQLLGTGGGLRNALPYLGDEPFIVFNGDVLAAPDLSAALAHHHATNAKLTMIVREDSAAKKAGAIDVTPEGQVVRMLGEGPEDPSARPYLFSGIYIVSPSLRDDLPEEGCVIRRTLRALLSRGERVSAVIDSNPWFDLGTIEAYASVQFALLERKLSVPGLPLVESTVWCGKNTKIPQGISMQNVVLGDGVEVQGTGALERVLAWDHARVSAPDRNVIVTSKGLRVAV